jgi:hypothetical protein
MKVGIFQIFGKIIFLFLKEAFLLLENSDFLIFSRRNNDLPHFRKSNDFLIFEDIFKVYDYI